LCLKELLPKREAGRIAGGVQWPDPRPRGCRKSTTINARRRPPQPTVTGYRGPCPVGGRWSETKVNQSLPLYQGVTHDFAPWSLNRRVPGGSRCVQCWLRRRDPAPTEESPKNTLALPPNKFKSPVVGLQGRKRNYLPQRLLRTRRVFYVIQPSHPIGRTSTNPSQFRRIKREFYLLSIELYSPSHPFSPLLGRFPSTGFHAAWFSQARMYVMRGSGTACAGVQGEARGPTLSVKATGQGRESGGRCRDTIWRYYTRGVHFAVRRNKGKRAPRRKPSHGNPSHHGGGWQPMVSRPSRQEPFCLFLVRRHGNCRW